MRARGFLYTSDGEPRLVVPGVLAVIATFVLALALITFTNRPRTEEERAEALVRNGEAAQAERVYARLLGERPSVPLVISLLDAHSQALVLEKMQALREETNAFGDMRLPAAETPMSEEELDELIASLPEDIMLVARFSRGLLRREIPPEVRERVIEGAALDPPKAWTNHLLGQEARRTTRYADAATFFEKEGVTFPERRSDVDAALQIWIELEAWDTLRDRLADERVAALANPHFKYRLAVYDRDWRAAARWLPEVWKPQLEGTGVVMSAVTALGWALFCARLGKLGARPRFRLPMYVASIALGMLSVVPTVLLIAIEEAKLRLVETGDPTRDLIFFVFGVGLREEASKLLLFLPLLPILRRWGDKLDVLVCGALVGLGFAAEENLNYLARENLHTGLGRFLTANFFHMAMTGTLASALDDFISDRERNAAAFTRTSLLVVGLHGIYDFLLSHPEFGGTYLAMTAFVFLTKIFLEAVESARTRADRGISPLHTFVFAVALVTGVSLAYATLAVGPKMALTIMGGGLLGEAIIVYVFVRTLRTI